MNHTPKAYNRRIENIKDVILFEKLFNLTVLQFEVAAFTIKRLDRRSGESSLQPRVMTFKWH